MTNCAWNRLYFFFILIFSASQIYSQSLKFEHLTTKDGLPSDFITALAQDNKGFMWIGTFYDGLCRYDGYNFKVYKNIPGDSTSLSNNRVNALFVDSKDQLWVGTQNYGLCRFDPVSDSFIRYKPIRELPTSP